MSVQFFKGASPGQYATTAEVQAIFDELNAELRGVKMDCLRHIDECCAKLHQDVHALSDSLARSDVGAQHEGKYSNQLDNASLTQARIQHRLQAQDVELTEIREVARGLEERCSILTAEVWTQGRELRESVEQLTTKMQRNQRDGIGVDTVPSEQREDAGNPTELLVLRELQMQDANVCRSLPMTPQDSPRTAEPSKPRSRRRTTIFRLPHEQGTVRIPRCTAPPTTFRELPSTAIAEPANPVWDDFGDQSDDDGILTPPAAGMSSSFTPPDEHTTQPAGCGHEEHEKSLITPDGIPIMLMEGSCEVEMEGVEGCTTNPAMEIVAGPTGFRPPRKSRLSIVVK